MLEVEEIIREDIDGKVEHNIIVRNDKKTVFDFTADDDQLVELIKTIHAAGQSNNPMHIHTRHIPNSGRG